MENITYSKGIIMALTRKDLLKRSSEQLLRIQKCNRGSSNPGSKEQFLMVQEILEERGVQGIDWNEGSSNSRSPKPNKSEVLESLDNITRREIETAKKHLQLFDSACNRGKEFNLSLSDTRRLVTRKHCEYTGAYLNDGNPLNAMTVDRIDADKGYVKGNVAAVSSKANWLKEHVLESTTSKVRMNPDELLTFALKMKELE